MRLLDGRSMALDFMGVAFMKKVAVVLIVLFTLLCCGVCFVYAQDKIGELGLDEQSSVISQLNAELTDLNMNDTVDGSDEYYSLEEKGGLVADYQTKRSGDLGELMGDDLWASGDWYFLTTRSTNEKLVPVMWVCYDDSGDMIDCVTANYNKSQDRFVNIQESELSDADLWENDKVFESVSPSPDIEPRGGVVDENPVIDEDDDGEYVVVNGNRLKKSVVDTLKARGIPLPDKQAKVIPDSDFDSSKHYGGVVEGEEE